MRTLFYLLMVLILSGCDDLFEDTTHFSKRVTQSKTYPVYLDMSEIGNIQVKARVPLAAPFKILSNDGYYFVGEQLKGVHVYEKKATGVNYLCFIECRYLKDFDLADNRLFCNNLLDMVVVDVSNPMQINLLHRQKNHFNQYSRYKEYWNIPYEEGKGLVVATETHELTGMITDRQLDLDFSALDQQYGNLTTKVIPDNWLSNRTGYDFPSPGIVNVDNEIFTYGTFDSWAICTYRSGVFKVREVDLWTTPRVNYAPPKYYSDAAPVRMFLEDSIIFNVGATSNLKRGYCDCILYDERYPVSLHFYFPTFIPVDICYQSTLNAFFTLSGSSLWGVFVSGDGVNGYKMNYKDYQVATDAVEIIRVGEQLITLGSELSVYAASQSGLTLVKKYPAISGKCCKKEENLLAVANTQGLFIYDITDPENIQLIP